MAHTDFAVINDHTIRILHDPKATKVFDILTVPVGFDGKDLSRVGHHKTLLDAALAVNFDFSDTSVDLFETSRWRFKDVERINGHIIRRVECYTSMSAYVEGYAVVPEGNTTDPNSNAPVKWRTNLTAARNAAGFVAKDSKRKTAPKSSYPQNQRGYDPHSHRAAK